MDLRVKRLRCLTMRRHEKSPNEEIPDFHPNTLKKKQSQKLANLNLKFVLMFFANGGFYINLFLLRTFSVDISGGTRISSRFKNSQKIVILKKQLGFF